MVIEVLLVVLVVELAIYLLSNYHRGFSARIRRTGLNVGLFTLMIDVGRLTRLKIRRSNTVSRVVGLIGIVNLLFLIILFYWIAIPSLLNIIRSMTTAGVVGESPFVPVVPGVTIKGLNIIYFLLSVAIAVAAHELSHALVAINEGIEVQSWGLGIFLVFPFAYVRINDESFNNAPLSSKVKVLSAGILSNTVLAIIIILLMNYISGILYQHTAVVIYGLDRSLGPDAPAILANIPVPSVINSINGTPIKTLSDLRTYLTSIANKSASLVLNISRFNYLIDDSIVDSIESYQLINVYKPSYYPRLGILVVEAYLPSVPKELYYLTRSFFWIYLVNISLAVFNAAPLIITDGGRIIDVFLRRYGLSKVSNVIQVLTIIIVAILIITGFANFI